MTRPAGARPLSWLMVAVLALGLVGCGGDDDAAPARDDTERAALLRVGTATLERALSYDSRTLARDLAEIDDLTTGDLRAELGAVLGDDAAATIRRTRARNAVTVLGIGTVAPAADAADAPADPVLLAFVRQTTTSRALGEPRSTVAALEVTLTGGEDDWQARDIRPVTPGGER